MTAEDSQSERAIETKRREEEKKQALDDMRKKSREMQQKVGLYCFIHF